jgi:predicted patatin/cPLA2 family phospholipase
MPGIRLRLARQAILRKSQMTRLRSLSYFSLFVSVACLSACVAPASRVVMSKAQQEAAFISDSALARFWGDEVTPELKSLVTNQYRQVKTAASRGVRPASLKRADYLAISGGGANGAFAAGFLKGWSKRGDRPEFEVVTGVSTGALAAPFIFLGTKYDAKLEQIYTVYGDRDIMLSRGIFGVFGSALYDNAPLRALISHYITDDVVDAIAAEYRIGRRLLVQTTNIDAQRPVVWDISAISASERQDRRDLIVNILLASASIPAVFPPVRLPVQTAEGEVYEELHVDGGVSAQVFCAPPEIGLSNFERKEFGHARSRSLYVIRNGQLNPAYESTTEKTISIAQRAIETLTKYQGVADLNRLEGLANKGHARLFYAAISSDFGAKPRSEFDIEYMRMLFDEGYRAGLANGWLQGTPVTPILAERQ